MPCHFDKVGHADEEGDEGMQRGADKEGEEVLQVTLTNAGAHPGAVVVLLLDADSARTAMERSWWSQYLTGGAVAEHIGVFIRVDDQSLSKAIFCKVIG